MLCRFLSFASIAWLVVAVPVPTRPSPSRFEPGDFRKLSGLGPGQVYSVMLRGTQQIGTARIQAASAQTLSAQLNVAVPAFGGFRGLLSIKQQSMRGDLEVKLDGHRPDGQREALREMVRADPYLLGKGVLTFRWRKGTRFFQLMRDRKGVPKVTTDWGTAALVRQGR